MTETSGAQFDLFAFDGVKQRHLVGLPRSGDFCIQRRLAVEILATFERAI
jgi:hypothetical protein